MSYKPIRSTVNFVDDVGNFKANILQNGNSSKICECCGSKCESFLKYQEEMKCVRHQVTLRDKRIAVLTEEKDRQNTSLKEMEKVIQLKEDTIINMKINKDKLLDMVDKLAFENASIRNCIEEGKIGSICDDQRPLKDRFAETLKDKVLIVTIRRKLRQFRDKQERLSQMAEKMSMEAEDQSAFILNTLFPSGECGTRPSCFLLSSDQSNGELSDNSESETWGGASSLPNFHHKSKRTNASGHVDHYRNSGEHRSRTKSGSGGLISFGGFKSFGHGISTHGGFQGLKQKLDLSFFDDAYVEEKLRRSSFGNEIKRMEVELKRFAGQTKDQNDNYQSSLYFIFGETLKKGKCLLENPRADFVKQLHESLTGISQSMREMMKIFRSGICAWMDREGSVKEKWLEESREKKDRLKEVETQVTPSDLMLTSELQKLSETVQHLTGQIKSVKKENVSKLAALEAEKEKSYVMTRYLQQKLFDLHDSLYEALHAVFRHRYHWTNRVPNYFTDLYSTKFSLENASKARINDFNMAVATAVDNDRKLLREFAYYFVSDETFGTDFSIGVPQGLPNAVNKSSFESKKRLPSTVQKRRSHSLNDIYETKSTNFPEHGEYSRKSKARAPSTRRTREKEEVNLAVKKHIKQELCNETIVQQRRSQSSQNLPFNRKTVISRRCSAVLSNTADIPEESLKNEDKGEMTKHSFPKLLGTLRNPTCIQTDVSNNIQCLPELESSLDGFPSRDNKNDLIQCAPPTNNGLFMSDFVIQEVISESETDEDNKCLTLMNKDAPSEGIETRNSLLGDFIYSTQTKDLPHSTLPSQYSNAGIFPTSPSTEETGNVFGRKVSGAFFRTNSSQFERHPNSENSGTESNQKYKMELKRLQISTEKCNIRKSASVSIEEPMLTKQSASSSLKSETPTYSLSMPQISKVQNQTLYPTRSSENLNPQRSTFEKRPSSSVSIKSMSLFGSLSESQPNVPQAVSARGRILN